MIKLIIKVKCILCLCMYTFYANAQSAWSISDYDKWNHQNFRTNTVFQRIFSTSNPDILLLDAAVFYMTNEERAKVGQPSLPYHKLLEVAAYNHSLKMATNNFFSHTNNTDATRRSTSDRGKLAGVSNPSFAENIAYNYPDGGSNYLQVAAKLVDQWMNSSGHKANILSASGKQMGCGTYYYNGRIYGTQVFQWFNNVIEDPNGGVDQLPSMGSNTNNYTPSNTNKLSTSNTTNNTTNNTTTIPTTNKPVTSSPVTQSTNSKNQNTTTNSKKSKSTSNRLSARLGLHANYPLGDVKNLSTDFEADRLTLSGSAMLGYRVGKSNYRKSVLGVFVNMGQYSDRAVDIIIADADQNSSSFFTEIELGMLIREKFRVSAGLGNDGLYTIGNSSNSRNYNSVTLGYSIGRKNIKFDISNIILIHNSSEAIEIRPAIGLVYKLNFLKI